MLHYIQLNIATLSCLSTHVPHVTTILKKYYILFKEVVTCVTCLICVTRVYLGVTYHVTCV